MLSAASTLHQHSYHSDSGRPISHWSHRELADEIVRRGITETYVQALERLAPDLPPRPGQVARHEFEYKRHGTLSFMINFDVATGRVVCPSDGPTRTEADFVAHVRRTVDTDPTAVQWHFVLDNLDIHRSETLVRYVAQRDGITDDLGVKYKRGVLRSKASRAAFLAERTRIQAWGNATRP